MSTSHLSTGTRVRIQNTDGLTGMTGTVTGRAPQFDQGGAECWDITFDRKAADGTEGLYTYPEYLTAI